VRPRTPIPPSLCTIVPVLRASNRAEAVSRYLRLSIGAEQ